MTEPKPRIIVRIRTSSFTTSKGASIRTDIVYLKRKSSGFNYFEEDISQIGADKVVPRVLNLTDTKDGIYEIVMCNESNDWETGTLDSWDYKLIPFTP